MRRLAASCFGLGWLPVAPGTWGSLPPAIVFGLMCYLRAPSVVTSIVMAALALIGSVVCVKCASDVIAATGKTDPGEVVADEFAGQAVTFIAIGTAPTGQVVAIVVLGFLLFRFFDIVKPFPIYRIQKLPKGWGILADDLLAGVYAAIVLQICISLWIGG